MKNIFNLQIMPSAIPMLRPGCIVKAINDINVMTTSQVSRDVADYFIPSPLRFTSCIDRL